MATGRYPHRILLQTLDPVAVSVSTLTRSGSTATATTATAHGLATGDRATIAGADQAAYNGTFVITVTGATTVTYAVTGTPATPATGTITATYASDRLYSQRRQYRDLVEVPGWWRALSGGDQERLGAGQLVSPVSHAIDVRYRASIVNARLRAVVFGRAYEVKAVQDLDGRRRRLTLLCVTQQEQAA